MLKRIQLLILVVLSAVRIAEALPPSTVKDREAQKEAARKSARADPTLTASIQEPNPAFTLRATQDGGKIAAKVGWKLGEAWDLGIQFEAPFDKNNPETTLADLEGLAGDTVGTLRAAWESIGFNPNPDPNAEGRLKAVCEDYNDTLIGEAQRARPTWRPIGATECTDKTLRQRGGDWADRAAKARTLAARELCAEYNKTNPNAKLFDRLKPKKGAGDLLPPGFVGYCDDHPWTQAQREAAEQKQLGAVCKDYNETPAPAILSEAECSYLELKEKGPRWEMKALRAMPIRMDVLSFTFSLSEPSFQFVDPMTLEEGKTAETNRSYGAAWGRLTRGFFFGFGYKRRETFKAGPRTELCRPIEGADALSCSEVRLGPPKKSEQNIASFDAKWQFRPNLALNVRLLYDFKEDLFNPHVLLYFLQQDDGVLNGGLDLSYDDENDFMARVFVGSKFNLFSN